MNTAEINKILSEKLGKTQKETREILEVTVDVLANTLVEEKSFTIPGLGTFGVKLRAARNAFNPALKAIVKLPPVKATFFHSSVGLKARVQEQGQINE